LRDLLTIDPADPQAPAGLRAFRDNIRAYNSALQMASSGMRLENPRGGISMIAIKGAVHHLLGPLLPTEGDRPQFAQLYIIDNAESQLQARLQAMGREGGSALDQATLRELQQMLLDSNTYVRRFQQVMDLPEAELAQYEIVLRADGTVDRRRYNAPTGHGQSEVAGFMPGEAQGPRREVKVRARGGGLTRISDLHLAYDPLHFVLFHPRGERGWDTGLTYSPGGGRGGRGGGRGAAAFVEGEAEQGGGDEQQGGRRGRGSRGPNTRITMQHYAAYFMNDRQPPGNALFVYGRRLYQEWLVDQYCKVESDRLRWVDTHQDSIRADVYRGLADALQGDVENATELGRRVVLPSSFIGGPRMMQQLYQDSMAIVRAHGKPDLFITVTCNPKWPEILEELLPGQQPNDRPDLIDRVFRLKLESILKDLMKEQVMGRVVGKIHVIEFQKRGLPHAHILVILAPEDKPRCPADYDCIVCAELPDKDTQPTLYSVVTSCMLHGPCGSAYPHSPCMEDGHCSKGYPKSFVEETVDGNGSYPVYRRREDGRTHSGRDGFQFDNRWVVPYNPAEACVLPWAAVCGFFTCGKQGGVEGVGVRRLSRGGRGWSFGCVH
jgi:hypothetical protein